MTKILKKKEKGINRHWKNYCDKEYLGAHNLEIGEEFLLTIARFEGEEMVQAADGTKSSKSVLYFKEDKPKMILNITNASIIAALYGNHPEDWIGKQVQIYSASVKAFGKQQDALRVRDFIPKIEVDVVEYGQKMDVAKNVEELKTIWAAFPVSVRNNEEMIALKDRIKARLSGPKRVIEM